MLCCEPGIVPFLNEAVTVVPYLEPKPNIEVMYLQEDGSLIIAGVFTSVTDSGSAFTIDHGGVSSGIIKLLK